MKTVTRPYPVASKAQLSALASSARQELIYALQRLGTASVADIAAALDKPADALYYHLRELQRVGLVETAGQRPGVGRQGTLYTAVSARLATQHEPRTRAKTKAIGDIVASMLRLGIRDYRKAANDPSVTVTGDHRDLLALRTTGWLTEPQVAQVNALIQRLIHDVSRPNQPGRLYGLTLLFTPLTRRGRTHRGRDA
jgi:DNA-binding transcriptional ArsR family regulator